MLSSAKVILYIFHHMPVIFEFSLPLDLNPKTRECERGCIMDCSMRNHMHAFSDSYAEVH